mgnify:CR=1 FL=1|tara:strand:- start:28 stop:684 length:657 start_codon:yes stop_codon:yes gene_type:complete
MEVFNKYRIYGRTKGRKKINLNNINQVNKYRINLSVDLKIYKNIIIDIGSGYGESTIFLAKKNPDSLIIAVERFLDGNINLSKKTIMLKMHNIKIFEGNVWQIFDNLKIKKYFKEIWILFPDPWPKNKHHKRRLISDNFLIYLHSFLKAKAIICISTDSRSYLISLMETIFKVRKIYKWENDNPENWTYKLQDLPHTKFYLKSEKSKTPPFFVKLRKI